MNNGDKGKSSFEESMNLLQDFYEKVKILLRVALIQLGKQVMPRQIRIISLKI
jgi:hypothetical protein